MKRNYWIITLVTITTMIIGGFLATIVLMSNKAGAPLGVSMDEKTVQLMLYYIAVDDNGKSGQMIGCGDSVVMVNTSYFTTDNVIRSSFDELLSNYNQYYGESGLYNALYNSNLKYVDSSINGEVMTVNLTGDLSLGGECDIPRVKYQLELTAQNTAKTPISEVKIFVNSKSLDDLLSLK